MTNFWRYFGQLSDLKIIGGVRQPPANINMHCDVTWRKIKLVIYVSRRTWHTKCWYNLIICSLLISVLVLCGTSGFFSHKAILWNSMKANGRCRTPYMHSLHYYSDEYNTFGVHNINVNSPFLLVKVMDSPEVDRI